MTPNAMPDPQQRPVLNPKRRQAMAAATSQAPAKPRSVGTMVAAGILGVAALGLFAWAALRTSDELRPAEKAPERSVEQVLEHGNAWLEKSDDVVPSERLRQAIRENPKLEPGRRELRTSLVRMNMRTLNGMHAAPAPDPAKPVVEPAKRPESPEAREPEPAEGGAFPGAPVAKPKVEPGEKPPAVEFERITE